MYIQRILGIISLVLITLSTMAVQPTHRVELPSHISNVAVFPDLKHCVVVTDNVYGKHDYITMIDMETSKALWRINVNNLNFHIKPTSHGLVLTTGIDTKASHTSLIDTHTGQRIYEFQFYPLFISSDPDVMIGYKKASSKTAEAYRLSNGEKLWTSKIKPGKVSFWSTMTRIDKNHLALIGKSLYMVDINTGHFISQPLKTEITKFTKADRTATAVSATLGIAAALLTGGASFFLISQGTPVYGVHSNILSHNNRIYISDRNNLYCYDHYLTPIWQHDFDNKTATNANLYINADTLVMTNWGIGYTYNGPIYLGNECIMTFDAKTGTETGRIDLSKTWDSNRFGDDMTCQPGALFMVRHDKHQLMYIPQPSLSVAMYDTVGNVIVFDKDYREVANVPNDKLAIMTGRDNQYTLYENPNQNNRLYVADDDLNIILNVEDEYLSAYLMQKKLFLIKKNEMLIYNITDSSS